jgi:hypothetical protein
LKNASSKVKPLQLKPTTDYNDSLQLSFREGHYFETKSNSKMSLADSKPIEMSYQKNMFVRSGHNTHKAASIAHHIMKSSDGIFSLKNTNLDIIKKRQKI